jgi:hypothetical protein
MAPEESARPHGALSCGARTRAGGACQQPAMKGQKRCRYHGGMSPQAKRAAAVRLERDRMVARLGRLGVEVPENANPLEVMQLALDLAHGDLEAMRHAVAELPANDPAEPVTRLYLETLDRAATISRDAMRAGLHEEIDQYRVRVGERQAEIIRRGLDAYREATGLPEDDHKRGMVALANTVRAHVAEAEAAAQLEASNE